ncbi:T9SS type B sorting domain-containing protein [Pontimicrobium sp. SW4]|uniref:T9SS type B sorting domain-containing protein n=1 Tax=Pontimicrobium sp. SW4 TaxID=3153519 RepID=A0AAU7BPN1_9FLAO
MTDGTRSNTCAGTFYDSGGVGNYRNNETITHTLCPNILGSQIQLDFTSFDLEANADFITIYNGPDTTYDVIGTFSATSPGLVTAALASAQPNPLGCLTIAQSTDSVNTFSGWEATISCFQPCQNIVASLDSTLPAADPDGIVRICQGDNITFNGSGAFSVSGVGASYELFMGDGVSLTGPLIGDAFSTNYTFNDEGIYEVSLVVTDASPQGCTSTNKESIFVYVSSTPDFTGTQAANDTFCLGESTTIEGVVTPVTQIANCANGGEETALGDIQGVTFTSTLDLDCFQSQNLTNIAQLESICIVMEHTYIGDLEITAISPNGQRVTLHNRTGTSLQLGNPIVTDGTGPGQGWEYCFSMSATNLLPDGNLVQSGTPTTSLTVEAGTYLPVGDFNDFVGTPIDGQWSLEIIDYLAQDDGTIFSWALNFDESLFASNYTFTPSYPTQGWDADLSITNTVGNTITVQPTTSGTHCYTYRVIDDFGCEYTEQVCVEVLPEVIPLLPTPIDLCDDNINDGFTVFDLTIKDSEITGGNPNWSVQYFETNADAISNTSPINPATSYTNTVVNSQTIYVRVTDSATSCFGFTTLDLNVLPNPDSLDDAPDIELCDDNNTGDNQEIFDLTLNEAYILNGEVGVTATYYQNDTDAQNAVNAIGTPTTYTNTSSPQTIYVRVTNDVTSCFVVVDFDILVNELPDATTVTDYFICEVNADGVAQFNLESKTTEILNGQNPTDFAVTYHISQTDANTGANPLASPYTNISNPQTIYANIRNINTNCYDASMSFNIEELNTPSANADLVPIEYTLCDDFNANDGFAQFDLTTQDAFVLDGQDPLVNVVSYYASQTDADAGVNALGSPYENTSNPQIIYARVDDTSAINAVCYATTELTLNVNLLPEFALDNNYVICVNTNGTEIIGPPLIDTGLSVFDYTFEWRLNNVVILGATDSSYLATQSGDYSVTVTNNITSCQLVENTTVSESTPPLVTATVTSSAFANNHIIEVEALGGGDYEYSLDNGPWQDSNIFENVSLGEHIVMVRDKNGCGFASTSVTVIDYPKFFTPNGDGYNDTWNISGINSQPNAQIFIFDRYGKLLKQISPTGDGWNGTFNGYNLPSADYWFTVKYIEPNSGDKKEYSAHFALKR